MVAEVHSGGADHLRLWEREVDGVVGVDVAQVDGVGGADVDEGEDVVEGLRQTEGGSELVQTPGESYKASSVKRIAHLHMDEHGSVKGIVKITYEVAPALTLRQTSLRGDNASLGVNSAKPSSIFFLMASKSK